MTSTGVKNLPASPGVYLFKNKAGGVIYIGKSGNLKNRVKSYFNKGAKFFNPAKIKMLSEIADVEIIKTASEIEALIKESELIKKYKPKFNVLMRDSKNYLYVGFSKESYPKIYLTHQKIQDPRCKIQDYVGPFTDGNAVRKSLRLLRGIFPYCTCKQKHAVKCLNAHMGRCLAVCCLKAPNDISNFSDRLKQKYLKNIKAIKNILSGRSRIILKSLRREIKQTIRGQNFERAQELKGQIESLEEILAHAQVLTPEYETSPAIFADVHPNFKLLGFRTNPERIETYDISNIHGQEAVGSMVVFERQKDGTYKPNKNHYRRFKIKFVKGINDPAMMAEIISRRLSHKDWPLPQLIIVDGGRTQLNAALKALGGRKIRMIALAKRQEEIYLPERKEPLLAQSFGLELKHLFQAIRDEAHRFAVTYHRKLHRRWVVD
ncbi:MAG: GIY-YIG nuclease family protein [Parcubacteria group bacterium]|nr:GIY-YIG nuclease family protein [Parcubacteria group bacterium]